MKKKIFVLIVTLLTLFASLTIPLNIHVKADGNYGDPNIDHGYVYNITKNLSDLVFTYNESRYFGTEGEKTAADDIEGWMENISLENAHKETIDAFWSNKDENVPLLKLGESNYIGNLSNARVMQPNYWINITIYNQNWSLIGYKNLSGTACYPFFRYHTYLNWNNRTDYEKNVTVTEDYNPRLKNLPQMELGDRTWTDPYQIYDTYIHNFTFTPKNYKGIIAIDNNTDTHFMVPPTFDQMWFKYSLGDYNVFYVNQTIGTWIRNAINNSNYSVKVDFYTRWENETVPSYNVIGQINGTDSDPNNVSIVGAHYDNMWNQGTIDEGAETALVLGIAKYIKDHELESKLTRTVKFIAFGGEEPGMRGAKD